MDCLIIGYNESIFDEDVERMKSMGTDSISFKDFGLGYINYNNKPYRALDILTHFYHENKEGNTRIFHNADVLWQVIMYLGTCLNKNGFSFDYINLFQLEKEALKEKLLKEDIEAIAITTTIYVSVHPILEVVSFVRKYNKTAKIIVGGPYISKQCEEMDTASNQSIFKLIDADFYINSLEGEATLLNLLREIKGNGQYDGIDNIAYRSGDDYIFTKTSKETNSLEDNMIDYSLFPKEHIGETVNIRTSKSCPFSCAYCGFPLRAEKYTFITVERVEKELNALRDVGTVKYLNFIDDTLNIPKDRFKEMLQMMIRNKYNFKWYSFYRSDFGDEEIIDLMKAAGCIGVFIGVESANDDMLKRMNKTARVEHYLKAIPYLKKVGITIFVSTIVGFPGETYETAKETIDFIEETKPDFFRPQIWWSDPLTPILQKKDEYGIKGLGFNWTHYTMDSKTAYDIFEKTFLSVENSIWVPDPGFNAYGMYYLMQRGMTKKQVETFLQCFISAVKYRILNPGKDNISGQVLDNLRNSCRFDTNEVQNITQIEELSGKRYKEAEKYWISEFNLYNNFVNTSLSNKIEITNNKTLSYKLKFDYTAGRNYRDVMIAAYSLVLSKLNIFDKITILTADDNDYVFPIILDINDKKVAGDFIDEIGIKMAEASRHRTYALNILENPVRMKEYGLQCPKFTYGFLETNGNEIQMVDRVNYFPGIYDEIGITFRLVKDNLDYQLFFDYNDSMYSFEDVDKIGNYMLAIIKILYDNPDILLEDVKVGEREDKLLSQFEEEEFNF